MGEGGFCEEGLGVAEAGAVRVVAGWAEVVGSCCWYMVLRGTVEGEEGGADGGGG